MPSTRSSGASAYWADHPVPRTLAIVLEKLPALCSGQSMRIPRLEFRPYLDSSGAYRINRPKLLNDGKFLEAAGLPLPRN